MRAINTIKVKATTLQLIRLGAVLNKCSNGAFLDVAVTEFLANHADEIEAHARDVLLVGAGGEEG